MWGPTGKLRGAVTERFELPSAISWRSCLPPAPNRPLVRSFRAPAKRCPINLRRLDRPDADVAAEAVKLLEHLPALWENADQAERRRILLTMLDAVYVDTVDEKSMVAIRPRPAFRPLLEIATMPTHSGFWDSRSRQDHNAGRPSVAFTSASTD